MVAAKAMEYPRQAANERQREAGGDRKSEGYKKSFSAPVHEPVNEPTVVEFPSGKAAAKAAKEVNVSARSVEATAKPLLPLGSRTAQRLMETSKQPLLTNPTRG
jgi:hypothetical protein